MKLIKATFMLICSLAVCGMAGCSGLEETSVSKKQPAPSSDGNDDAKNTKSDGSGSAENGGDKANPESITSETVILQLGEVYSFADKTDEDKTAGSKSDASFGLKSDVSSVSFASSDGRIVSFDDGGNAHALKEGNATVSVPGGDTDLKYNVKVKKRGMVYPVFSMMKGESFKLQFSNDVGQIHWRSSDSGIATVNREGNVTAKAVGNARITGVADKHTYVCELSVTKKIKSIIYLTFDDGPSRYSTPKILDILKKNDIKATFFELRPAGTDFDLTKRVIDEGHTLALHGFEHKYEKVYRSEKIYRENLDRLRDMFFRKFGAWCTVTRFPGGSSNTASRYNKGIMTRLTKKLDGWGYTYFDWNVSSCDAGGAKNSKQVYHSVRNGLIKGNSNVVLMHDFTDNDKTINALQKIINYGRKNGYTFLPLSASTAPIHHGVSN